MTGSTGPKGISDDAILDAIRAHILAYGCPPTIRDLGAAVGLTSTSSVHARLRRLQSEGRLTWGDGKVRTLQIREVAS